MRATFESLRQHPMFPGIILVPVMMALIFSLFNLSAPPNPERLAENLQLGLVNQDEGIRIPPLNAGSRLAEGFGERFPFKLVEFDTEGAARAALEAEEIVAILLLPPSFTKDIIGDEPVPFSVINGGHLTMAESQISAQLPGMLTTGIAAAVTGIRLAFAKGQLPGTELPVAVTSETIHPLAENASGMAPFVSAFVIWLASLVGAILTFLSLKGVGASGPGAAGVTSLLPIISSGIATLMLAIVVSLTAGTADGFIQFWLTCWALMVVISLLFNGLLALVGLPSLIILVPVVFYQGALGGSQIPLAAAPDWLQAASLGLPFDHVGAVLRSSINGGSNQLDPMILISTLVIGLALIWGKYLISGRKS